MKASRDRVTEPGGKREDRESCMTNRRGAALKFIMPFQPCPGTDKGGESGRKGLWKGSGGEDLLSINLDLDMV